MGQKTDSTDLTYMQLGSDTAVGSLADDFGGSRMNSIPDSTIGIGVDLGPAEVLGFALRYDLRQIVQKSSYAMETELKTSAVMLKEPELFLKYPLASILTPDRVCADVENELTEFSIDLVDNQDRIRALQAFSAFTESILKSNWLRDDAFLVADELIANATLHGRLTPGASSLSVGRDLDRIVICVRDAGGTLDFDQLVRSVSECYERMSSSGIAIDEEKGSAAIGNYFIYNACISYYGGAKKGEATVVCCALPIRRDRQNRGIRKNLHLTPK